MNPSSDEDRRLRALSDTGLMDSAPSEEFDRLTRVASRALGVPISSVSLIDGTRQFFKSQCGLPEPLATSRETPLSHSFCKHIVETKKELIVPDARQHPLLKENPAIHEFNIIAYAGIPLSIPDAGILGVLNTIHTEPHTWSEDDLLILRDLADIATGLVQLKIRVSEEAVANHEAAESKRRLNQILDSTGEGIYGIDETGLCTFANRKTLEVLGFESTGELMGKPMHDLIHHQHKDGTPYPIGDCLIFKAIRKDEGVYSNEEVFWKKDGTPIPVEYRSYPVVDGGTTRAVVTFVDISDQIRREELLENALDEAENANRQKSRFLTNMSHEIRTPMNAILGFGELLDGVVGNAKAKSYVAAIRASGDSLLKLIDEILDLSKIESGKFELRLAPTQVRGLIESVRLIFAEKVAEQNLDFAVEIDEDCPDYLMIDELRIRQILLNLLGNALKFTEKGEVKVDVGVEKDPLDDRRITLVLSIFDTGIGIPEKQQKSIFLPFRQVDESDSINGTGLGLSICRRLSELMGGRVELESTVGQGSRFTVTIPGVEVALSPEGDDREHSEEAEFNLLKPSKILVVDDNQFNRDLVEGYLEGSHHRVATAGDGREGVEKVRDWNPDVVLMDIRMPIMDGKEARRRIKEDPELQNIAVLAVTASSMLHHARELKREFDGYMRKPYSAKRLFCELAKVLPKLEDHVIGKAMDSSEEDQGTSHNAPIADWGPMIDKLKIWQEKRAGELLNVMVIGEIADFAGELKRTGKAVGCNALTSYAETLRNQADHFELSKIEATLGGFGELVDRIEKLWEMASK